MNPSDHTDIQQQAISEKIYTAEKHLAIARSLIIVFNSASYMLMDKEGTIPWLAYLIIATAWIYAGYILLFKPYKKYEIFLASWFSTITDVVFISLWIAATGGFESYYFTLWYAAILSVAFRFSQKTTLIAAVLYSACYISLLSFTEGAELDYIGASIRCFYIFILGYIASLITKEAFMQTHQKKKMEKLAYEAQHAQQTLRIQTDLYQNLLKAQSELGEGVCITEGERFVYVNEAISNILGYNISELLQLKTALLVIHPADKRIFRYILTKKINNTHPLDSGELRLINKFNESVHVSFSVKKLDSYGPNQLFFMIRDVTEHKKAKESLKQKTIDLEKSREEEQKKDDFIGFASHELKTPITSVKAYLQLLQRVLIRNESKDSALLYLEKTELYLGKLSSLINDLLDVSKIQTGKLEFNLERFRFDELYKEVLENMQHTSQRHKIIRSECPEIWIFGDKIRLEQVFINLISNAIKYSPEADKIIVEANVNNGLIEISVIDFGIGIPDAKQKKIFEKFYRVEEASKKFQGLGIGLYISSEIIKRHNGRFGVESVERKGSRFWFTLPALKPTQKEKAGATRMAV
jgi:two-component system, sensor histidine kinase and response regulator